MNEVDPKLMLFRKGLSTVVETTLEGIEGKPFVHFINNVFSAIKTIKNAEQFAKEAYHAQSNGMLQELKDEMNKWYSGAGGYDAEITAIVVNQITDLVFVCIGGMYGMVEEIKMKKSNI